MVQQHIYDLLLDNDCVVVPGLGGFVCQYHPASIDHRKGIMTPPGRSVAFNKALQQNDGLLTQHISVTEAISYKLAEDKVREFVAECNQKLHQHGSLLLSGIGRLYMDDLRHIQFSPASELLPLEDAFGLLTVQVRPVTRLKDLISAPQEEPAKVVSMIPETSIRQQKSWPYWIAASVAVVFLSATIWMNAQQPGVSQGLKAGFSFLQHEVMTNVDAPADNVEEAVESPRIIVSTPVAEAAPIVQPTADMHTFSIVVGAFKGPITAGRYAEELRGRGYESEVVDPGKKMWLKVVVHVKAEDELTALRTIRSEVEPQAWLLQ